MNYTRVITLILVMLLAGCSIQPKPAESDMIFSQNIAAGSAQVELVVTFDTAPFHDPANIEKNRDPSPRMSLIYKRPRQGMTVCASQPFFVYPCVPKDFLLHFRTVYGERLDGNRYRFRIPKKIGWDMPHSAMLNYVRNDGSAEQDRFAVTFTLGTAWHEERPAVCPQRIDVPGDDGSGLSVAVKQRDTYCFGLEKRVR